jgi:GTP-binding protein
MGLDIEFLCSSPSLRECPRHEFPEFAFIGRSNVGKSSLINMLAGVKGLAKVSGTPGKTRLINHFKVTSPTVNGQHAPQQPSGGVSPPRQSARAQSHQWLLVDLPGYGFAKISKVEREKFEGMIRNYLLNRENLACTFLLIDARLEAQQIDLDFMSWLGDNDISFIVLFTKSDKLSKTRLEANLENYRKRLSESWYELPLIVPTSSETRMGRDDVLNIIAEMLQEMEEE